MKKIKKHKLLVSSFVLCTVVALSSIAYLSRITPALTNIFELSPIQNKYVLHYDVNTKHGGVSGAPDDQEESIPPANENYHYFDISDAPNIQGQEGKVFMGWDEDPDAKIPTYGYNGIGKSANLNDQLGTVFDTSSLDKEVKVTKEEGRQKTLYAIWATYYEVSFDANAKYGGQGNVPDTQSALSVNALYVFHIPAKNGTSNVPSKEGRLDYDFEKWGLSEDRPLTGESEQFRNYWMYDNDIILYADGTMKDVDHTGNGKLGSIVKLWARYYTGETFKLFFYENNLPAGVHASNMPNPNPEIGDGTLHIWSHRISSNIPTAPNRHFRGWSTDPNATTPEIQPGDLVEINRDIDYTKKLYAIWQEPHTFSITLHGNADDAEVINSSTYLYYPRTSTTGNAVTLANDKKSIVLKTKGIDAKITEITVNVSRLGVYRKGYKLLGYATKPDGNVNDIVYQTDGTATVSQNDYWYFSGDMTLTDVLGEDCPGGNNHNLDLYAIWEPIHQYEVVFEPNCNGPLDTIRYPKKKTIKGTMAESNFKDGFVQSTWIWRSQYLSLDVDSYTIDTSYGIRCSDRDDGLFLGWSDDPNATEPDPKYALDSNGKFINPITLEEESTDCSGAVVHTKTLYGVWTKRHSMSIILGQNTKKEASFECDTFKSEVTNVAGGYSYIQDPNTKKQNARIVYYPSLSIDQKSFTIPAGTLMVSYLTASGTRTKDVFLGWSRTPDASQPDADLLVDEEGKLLQDIVLTCPETDCPGGVGSDGYVLTHNVLHIYPVFQYKHAFELNVEKSQGGDQIGGGWIPLQLTVPSDWEKLDQVIRSPWIDTTETSTTISAGTMQLYYISDKDSNGYFDNFYEFLGWSWDRNAKEPDPELALDENGYFIHDIVLNDPDTNCEGGAVTHRNTLYGIFKLNHKSEIFFSKNGGYGHWKFENVSNDVWKYFTGDSAIGQFANIQERKYRSKSISNFSYENMGVSLEGVNGYVFLGWSTDKNATEPDPQYELNEDGTFKNDITVYHDDTDCKDQIDTLVLYAVWGEAHRYELSFQKGDAEKIDGYSNQTTRTETGSWIYTNETTYQWNANTLLHYAEKGKYRFLGWSLTEGASVPDYRVNAKLSSNNIWSYSKIMDDIVVNDIDHDDNCADKTTHVIKLYPVFDMTYGLHYDINGGSTTEDIQDQTYVDDKPFDPNHTFTVYDAFEQNNVPKKDRFHFMGWSDTQNGTLKYGYQQGISDNNGALYRLTKELDKTITLTPEDPIKTIYAVYYYEFRFRYHLPADAFASWGQGVDDYFYSPINNTEYTISGAIPTWVDPYNNIEYEFLGWSTSPNGNVEYGPGEKFIATAGNDGYYEINLYAVFDTNPLSTTEVEEKPQAKTETKPIEQVIPKVEKVQEPIESVEPKVVEQPIEEQMVVGQEPMVQEPPKVEEGQQDEQVS